MRSNRIFVVAAAVAALLAAPRSFAAGAGGVTHGYQPLDVGGGWYRADARENCVGVGGLINGQQISIGLLAAAAVAWTGVGCAGMQVMGDVSGGRPFDEFLFWTPVDGARIAWGSF